MLQTLSTKGFEYSLWDGINEKIDKRACGYKRRQEALQSSPQVITSMLDRALAAGATASYVLMVVSLRMHLLLVKLSLVDLT